MKIEVLITDQPLHLEPLVLEECGAVARFDGLVRGSEDGASIAGLAYEAYQPMAENVIRRLLESLNQKHPFELARVHHRIGWVPVGEAAIVMDVHSKHRAEAFNVVTKFMDRLKQEVPIWKLGSATFQVASEDGSEPGSTTFQVASKENRELEACAPQLSPFFNPDRAIDKTRHWLPHWQQSGVWQFVTWRLADALPSPLLDQWTAERDQWLKHHPEPWDERTENDYHRLFSERIDEWLDAGHGSCLLRQPELSGIVVNALEYFHNQRYWLDSYVVMPNHVHVLFCPAPDYSLDAIVHSWKSFTANEVNRHIGRQGPLWQHEYFDRMMRSEAHFLRTRDYMMRNPENAKLGKNQYRRATFQVASKENRELEACAPRVTCEGKCEEQNSQ